MPYEDDFIDDLEIPDLEQLLISEKPDIIPPENRPKKIGENYVEGTSYEITDFDDV